MKDELSAWAGGAVIVPIHEQTPLLDLRAALGQGRFVLMVVDSTSSAQVLDSSPETNPAG